MVVAGVVEQVVTLIGRIACTPLGPRPMSGRQTILNAGSVAMKLDRADFLSKMG